MKRVHIKEIDKFGSTHDSQELTVCRLILHNYSGSEMTSLHQRLCNLRMHNISIMELLLT